MNGQTDKLIHDLCLKQRKELSINGVKDIDSFDEGGAVLKTTLGELTVEGEGLRMGTLDTDRGLVTISGKINAMYYSGEGDKEKRGLMSRLFK